jgi:ribosome-binding factor A
MQQYLEELFTCNTAQIILDHLGGAALSVEKVTAPSTRGVHDVYMRLSSNHDQAWVQKKLDILTPKIRSQLAVRVNYGYTPELKFHILDDVDKFRKSRLMRLADQAKREVDKSLNKHFMTEMNWK